jgi:hypothetical protein
MRPLDVDQVLYPMSYRDLEAGAGFEPANLRLMRPARTTELLHPASPPGATRTRDRLVRTELLCPLSYRRKSYAVRESDPRLPIKNRRLNHSANGAWR